MLECDDSEKSKKIAYAILTRALLSPAAQILTNAGKDFNDIYYNKSQVSDWNYGYDVKAEKYGDMFKMGIIDPAKVTKNALRNAVSVATTILSTNAIVTMKRQ
jgi:chaperonin GroEL